MVFQRIVDYGSCGYQVPAFPRVPKSAKGKRSVRKKFEKKRMCAFDLLATVAGNLLLEKENSSSSANLTGTSNPTTLNDTVKQGLLDEGRPLKPESFDQGSCNECALGSEAVIERQVNYSLNAHSQIRKASASRHASVVAKSDVSDGEAFGGEFLINGRRDESKFSPGLVPKKCNTERHSPGSVAYEGKVDDGIKSALRTERKSGYLTDGHAPDKLSLDVMMDVDMRPLMFVSSDSSVEEPAFGDHIPCKSSFPKSRDDMELDVDRDDDENSSGCTRPSTLNPKVIRPQCVGDRKIRKLLTSKHWRVAPTFLKDGELYNTDVETKPIGMKVSYTRQRTQRSSFKRRKVFERCSISASEGGICGKGLSIPSRMDASKVEASGSCATLHGANGTSSSMIERKTSYEPGDFHVKLSIKSFKVPELFIEMPETATVGSLKRTVMEAVTAILGGGLGVGVLLQGKKVRDDTKTLLQAGISHNDKLDNLGFTLEPNPTQTPTIPTSPEDPHFLLPCDGAEPLTRIPHVPPASEPVPSNHISEPPSASVVNTAESDHDSVQSPSNVSFKDKLETNSRALVTVPPMSVEALAVVPLRKSKQAELVQRRIRRPFSVSEVEALVQAVEKLGTGRWRDVKLRAFDNAKHRTYVDLKDKWKTLVHTARISPQQRRGEPVPQELLDRVLSAHAYWSHQQAKLQVKPQQVDACLLV